MKLILRDIRKEYNGACILHGLSYTFESGKVYGISGGSGSGKTTLLRCIAREYDYTGTDTVIEAGKSFFNTDVFEYALLDKEIVMPRMITPRQYIKQCIKEHKGSIFGCSLEEYAELFGLPADKLDVVMKRFTGEELQIIQMIAVSIIKPAVVLMDEIIGYFVIPQLFFEALNESIVIIAEDDAEKMETYCDEILYLENGSFSSGVK